MSKEEREENLREKVRELNEITNSFVNKVNDIIKIRKIFGK